MTKNEYLRRLENELKNVPKSEAIKCLAYYNEIIEDYMEDGLSEPAAVSRLDSPFAAAQKFLNEQNISYIPNDYQTKPQNNYGNFQQNTNYSRAAEKPQNNYGNFQQNPMHSETTVKPKQKSGLPALLVILLFPIWFPLFITFYSVAFAIFITIWSLIIAFYACMVAFVISGVASILYCPVHIFLSGNIYLGIAAIVVGLILIAVSLIMSVFAKSCYKGLSAISIKFLKAIKFTFFKKEAK